MTNIFIFYFLIISYFTFVIYYVSKKVKIIKNEGDGDNITYTIHKMIRNILFFSIFLFMLSTELLYKINSSESISQSNIGIALASATLIFYVMFLIRDIYKDKISKYLQQNYNIYIEDNSFVIKGSAVIIICMSILLLNFVISIMILNGGI